MFLNDVDWRSSVEKAEHYRAIGETRLYLSDGEHDFPWSYATSVGPGCSHRLGIPVSVEIVANHPCGLTFRWSFDLEKRGANGSGTYDLDQATISGAMAKLPQAIRQQLVDRLTVAADAIQKLAAEMQESAAKQFAQAFQLRSLVALGVPKDAPHA